MIRKLEQLSRAGQVVPPEALDPGADEREGEQTQQRAHPAGLALCGRDLEGLRGDGDEVEPEREGRAAQAEARVGLAGRDGERHGSVLGGQRPPYWRSTITIVALTTAVA